MRALLVAAVLFAGPAIADSEARSGADSVRITAFQCSDEKVLAHIAAAREDAKDYRAARAEYQGATYAACWRPMFEQKVIVLWYEDGDQGTVPFRDLKPVKEA